MLRCAAARRCCAAAGAAARRAERAGWPTAARRWHGGGHGHGAALALENAEEDDTLSAQDREEQRRITWLGLWSNVGLSAVKGVVGVQSGSVSLIADAFHSASDLCGDFVALAALNLAQRPPDDMHPYGYGHYESLATLAVSALLIGGGVGIGHHAFEQLFEFQANASPPELRMVPAALGIIGFSVVVKEWLYRRTVDVGQRTRSPVLVANAWHHRTDAFSSIVALVGISGTAMGTPLLDPVAGLLVSGMVLKAGGDVGWDAVQDLTDRRRDSDQTTIKGVYDIARDLSLQAGSGIIDVHDVRVRRLGHYMLLDLHLRVDPRLSVTGGYFEKRRIKRRIHRAFPSVSEIFIHVQAHPSRSQKFTSSNYDSDARSLSLRRYSGGGGAPPKLARANSRKHVLVSRSVRTQFQIEQDVSEAVAVSMADDPVVLGLAHALVHYNVAEGDEMPFITVEANLRMDTDITLRRAEQAAHLVRERILEIPDVHDVDIHVELLES